MNETPICDRWEYESYSSGLVVPLNVAQELETELANKDRQLAEARADAEHWKGECNALQRMVHESRAEIEALKRVNVALNEEIKIQRAYVTSRDNTIDRKDELIEQMLEALEAVAPFLHWLDQEQGIHLAGDMLHGNILEAIKAAKRE